MPATKLPDQSSQSQLNGDIQLEQSTSFAFVEDEADSGSFGLSRAMNVIANRRANKRSLLMVFRQLSLLVETGIDVAEALELVSATTKHSGLQDCLLEIYEDINRGTSLGTAVASQEDILGREVAASVQAGEASGKLVEVLRQISDRLEQELQVQSEIRTSLAYPGVLCSASVAVALVLIWFVLPQFEQSFQSMGVDPPAITEFLLSSAEFIRGNVALVCAGMVGVGASLLMAWLNPNTRGFLNNCLFHSPLVGPPVRHLEVGRLFISLGHLLANGVSLLEALGLVKNINSYRSLQRMTSQWEDDVVEGKGLTDSLDEFGFLPEGADAMLMMAERTGKLESVLRTAGQYYQEEGSRSLKAILKLSEPVIIILLGAFVGTVVASVLLPILDVQSSAAI